MEEVDDPTDFKDPKLQKLDHDFRCAICKELFTTPVQLTTCVHSFCSICIRRRLTQERHCPTCRTPADESKLIRNSVLDDCVNSWRSAVRQLIIQMQNTSSFITPFADRSQQQHYGPNATASAPPPLSTPPIALTTDPRSRSEEDLLSNGRRSQRIQQKQHQTQSTPIPTSPIATNDDDSGDFIPVTSTHAVASTRGPSPRKLLPSPSQPEIIDLTEESDVHCPICSQTMKQNVINAHLDRCMRGDCTYIPSTIASSSRAVGPLSLPMALSPNKPPIKEGPGKKPVKLVYDMLKQKDLQKIMRDLELPDWGDKQLLVWRHKEYVTLYHANKDAARPVSGSELRRQLAELENAHNSGQRGQRLASNMDEHNILLEPILN